MSMSTVLDSEATFEQQAANEAGLSQPWIDALKNDHMATFAKLVPLSRLQEWFFFPRSCLVVHATWSVIASEKDKNKPSS